MTIYTFKVFSVTGQYSHYATVRTHALFVFRSSLGISLSLTPSRGIYILQWQKESKQLAVKEKEVEEEVSFFFFFSDCITFVKMTFVSNLNTSTIIPLLDKEKKDDGKLKPAQSVKVTMSRDRDGNVQSG